MNTSRPRTFSLSSTLTSPSLNRSTSARPNGTCKCRVISVASGALALPVNTAIDNEPNSLFCCIDLARVGWGGRIRTSVWRDQNPLPYRLATPQLENQSSALLRSDAAQPAANLSSKGESFSPRARNASNAGCNLPTISRACVGSQAIKTQAPVPVRRAAPKSDSQSIARATSGYLRRTTAKQSFPPPEARKP